MRWSCLGTVCFCLLLSGWILGPIGQAARAQGPTIAAVRLPDPLEAASPIPMPPTEPRIASAPSPIATRKTIDKVSVDRSKSKKDAREDEIELVTERYPGGSIEVEREVTLDEEGNYVNHGVYTSFDQNGAILRTGEYRMGRQVGIWTRYFKPGEGHLFSGSLDRQFLGPFVSEANFVDGEIHGPWIIRDKNQQKIIDWQFSKGVRHGRATWFYPTGVKRCEVTYKDGVPDGEYVEWNLKQQVTQKVKFVKGQSLVKKVESYAPNRKQYEGYYLTSQPTTPPVFSWWDGTVAASPLNEKGPRLKHGKWASWYYNGKQKMKGEYRENVPIGQFTWWYENGQKQAEGFYLEGLQDGKWTTWHPSGMKESSGTYSKGVLSGKWMRWKANGKLGEVHDFSIEPQNRSLDDEKQEKSDFAPGRIDEVKRTSPLLSDEIGFRLPS